MKEHGFDHVSCLGRHLKVANFKFIRHGFPFLRRHHPLLKIRLVANQDRIAVIDLVVVVHPQPSLCVVQWCSICYVVNDDGTKGILQVAGNQGTVSLLSGCVPQLQSVGLALVEYIFCQKINTHSRLYQIMAVQHYWRRISHWCTFRWCTTCRRVDLPAEPSWLWSLFRLSLWTDSFNYIVF